MPLLPDRIMGAHHVYPGVNSRLQYQRWQADNIARNKREYRHMPWGDPHAWAGATPLLYIAGGTARIECPTEDCNTSPAVWIDEQGGLACCVECGCIVEHILVPAEWSAIEAELIKRRVGAHRYWNPEISVADLQAQNASGTLLLKAEV